MAEAITHVNTVLDPQEAPLAAEYAEALMSLVPGNEEAQALGAELEGVVSLLDSVDGFDELLTAATLSASQRAALVDRIARDRMGETMQGLLSCWPGTFGWAWCGRSRMSSAASWMTVSGGSTCG